MEAHRDNSWLTNRLDILWGNYFSDLFREPNLVVRFGVRAKQRLGSIKRRNGHTVITITNYYRSLLVPDYVVDETITHELVHYSHGFESPLPRLYRYPHEGNIVHRELAKRGLSVVHRDARRWLKTNWLSAVRQIDRQGHF